MQADDLPSLYTNKYKLDDSRTDALSWQRYVNMFVRLYDVQEGQTLVGGAAMRQNDELAMSYSEQKDTRTTATTTSVMCRVRRFVCDIIIPTKYLGLGLHGEP